ncbi:MAG: dephospho-CoA kinase [Pseudomonadota bacterium]
MTSTADPVQIASRRRPLRIGLTGSIATGKSTTAQMFADEGIPVHDSDASVHALYREEGVEPVRRLIPQAIIDGVVDRATLKDELAKDPGLLAKLEAIVHPLVQARADAAAEQAHNDGHRMIVFDIPLLFETGAEDRFDQIVVTFCDDDEQMRRLMARPTMTIETARMLLERQMPQADKRARADFTIDTGGGIDAARMAVRSILNELSARAQ